MNAFAAWLLLCITVTITGCEQTPLARESMQLADSLAASLAELSASESNSVTPEQLSNICGESSTTHVRTTTDAPIGTAANLAIEATVARHLRDLKFRCALRSTTRIADGAQTLSLTRATDFVAWRLPSQGSSASVFVSVSYRSAPDGSLDVDERNALAAILGATSALVRWRDSSRGPGAGVNGLIITLHDLSRHDLSAGLAPGPELVSESSGWTIGSTAPSVLEVPWILPLPPISHADSSTILLQRPLVSGQIGSLTSSAPPEFVIQDDFRVPADLAATPRVSTMARRAAQAVWSSNALSAGWRPWHPFRGTADLAWLAGFLLPVLFIAAVAKLVVARAQDRLRIVSNAASRTERWLAISHMYCTRRNNLNLLQRHLQQSLESTSSHFSVICARLAILRLQLARRWVVIRSSTGNYLDEKKRQLAYQDTRFFDRKLVTYKEQHRKDRDAARGMFREMWSGLWTALLSKHGIRHVIYGALAVLLAIVSASITAYALSLRNGMPSDTMAPGPGIVAALIVLVVGRLGERGRRKLFAWGGSIIMFLGLTIIEIGSLAGSAFQVTVDSQKVDAMFLAVAVLLSLREFLDSPKRLPQMAVAERSRIRRSAKLTVWTCAASLVGVLGTRERLGRLWARIVVLVYSGLALYFVGPMIGALGTEQDPRVVALGGAIVALTVAVLLLPLLVFTEGGEGRLWRGAQGRVTVCAAIVLPSAVGCGGEEPDVVGVEVELTATRDAGKSRWILVDHSRRQVVQSNTWSGGWWRGKIEFGDPEVSSEGVAGGLRRVPVKFSRGRTADGIVLTTAGDQARIVTGGELAPGRGGGYRQVRIWGESRGNEVSLNVELPCSDSVVLGVREWFIGIDERVGDLDLTPPDGLSIRDSVGFQIGLSYSIVEDSRPNGRDPCGSRNGEGPKPPPWPRPTLYCWPSNAATGGRGIRQYVCESRTNVEAAQAQDGWAVEGNVASSPGLDESSDRSP